MPMFKRDRDPFHTSTVPVETAQPPASAKPPAPAAYEPPAREATAMTPSEPVSKVGTAPQQPAPAVPVTREAAAVIDKKTEITGTLHSQGNVLVEGCFQGEIEAKETVWVDKGAQTQGQLRANDAVVSGSFSGEITCEHRLQITATATISGEIKTPVLVVEEGATVNCRFSMTRAGR